MMLWQSMPCSLGQTLKRFFLRPGCRRELHRCSAVSKNRKEDRIKGQKTTQKTSISTWSLHEWGHRNILGSYLKKNTTFRITHYNKIEKYSTHQYTKIFIQQNPASKELRWLQLSPPWFAVAGIQQLEAGRHCLQLSPPWFAVAGIQQLEAGRHL